jgi:hypothetical protein
MERLHAKPNTDYKELPEPDITDEKGNSKKNL